MIMIMIICEWIASPCHLPDLVFRQSHPSHPQRWSPPHPFFHPKLGGHTPTLSFSSSAPLTPPSLPHFMSISPAPYSLISLHTLILSGPMPQLFRFAPFLGIPSLKQQPHKPLSCHPSSNSPLINDIPPHQADRAM